MRASVIFYLNGSPVVIEDETVFDSLANWLRKRRGLVGTKIVCDEGDCGACSVLVGRLRGAKLEYRAVDACITFLFQLDQTHVVTVEGLTPPRQLSDVQQAMVNCHGSQCGFCTPGFVVTMHGLLEHESTLSEQSIRDGLSGNLCRCTGYLSILQAGLSIDGSRHVRLNELYSNPALHADLKSLGKAPVKMQTARGQVFIPRTLEQAVVFRAEHPNSAIVCGATDYGVLRNHGRVGLSDTLCLSNVEDYSSIKLDQGVLSIGGGATWQAIEAFIKPLIPEYHAILTRFGSPQIRHAGTIAGNLASGSPIADSIPFHMVLQSELELRSVRGTRRVKIEDFFIDYRKTALADDELIASIETRLPTRDEKLKLFKISRRRDLDISTVTMGLWLKLEGQSIRDARLAIGGVGSMVLRLRNAEDSLRDQPFSEATFRHSGAMVRQAIQPWSDVRGSAAYRLELAERLLLRAYFEIEGLSENREHEVNLANY